MSEQSIDEHGNIIGKDVFKADPMSKEEWGDFVDAVSEDPTSIADKPDWPRRDAIPEGIPFSTKEENDTDQFLTKAKNIVSDWWNKNFLHPTPDAMTNDDVYIVWFSKTLQNWKALLSTNRADGRYYEITYNGNVQEAYLDIYIKQFNIVVPDYS